ncbi:MAG: 2TM domain-containing protein [Candidatus Aenigmarchaeota archaeon]|nr:2TM domain-containing protein [Candidatus Aenigmarchaeota archaeon]
MSINESLVRTKAMFRKHFLVYLVLIVVLGVANLFIFAQYMWILYFVVGWGTVIIVHHLYVRRKTQHYKKSDSEFLKTKATELKSGIPVYSEIKEQNVRSEFIREKQQPDTEPAVQEEEPIDMEKLEMAEIDIIRMPKGKASSAKKKPSKRKVAKRKPVIKKKTARKTIRKKATKRKPVKKKKSKR